MRCRLSLLRMHSFPAPRVRETSSKLLRSLVVSWAALGASLHFRPSFPAKPNLQGETGSYQTTSSASRSGLASRFLGGFDGQDGCRSRVVVQFEKSGHSLARV